MTQATRDNGHNIAIALLAKADKCDLEAKTLGMPAGSTAHMCANVWRAAASIANRETLIMREASRTSNAGAKKVFDASKTTAWLPIDTAPKDGTVIDLWIIGHDNSVDFYAPQAKKVAGMPMRHGRATDFRWDHKPPNAPNWYPRAGLGYPLSPEVEATHWMPQPKAPTNV